MGHSAVKNQKEQAMKTKRQDGIPRKVKGPRFTLGKRSVDGIATRFPSLSDERLPSARNQRRLAAKTTKRSKPSTD
jgi:hypothetical protein